MVKWILPLLLVAALGATPLPSCAQGAKPTMTAGEKKAAAAGLTANAVKEFINRREKRLATGVGSSHKSVTLKFDSVRFGASRAANARDRAVNGITGKTVFPVRARYVSHRVWGNGQSEDITVHYDYEFYRDSFGEWDAYFVGPVR